MGLDAISGTGYNDAAAYTQQAAGSNYGTASNINIKEIADTTVVSNTDSKTKEEESKVASGKEIQDAITKANSKLKEHRTRCEFSYHEDTNRVTIKVIDRNSDKVIKEIPPEESLKVLEKIWELAGILVDEKR